MSSAATVNKTGVPTENGVVSTDKSSKLGDSPALSDSASLGDAMILLDQFLAKISPVDAPALIEAALAKRNKSEEIESNKENQWLGPCCVAESTTTADVMDLSCSRGFTSVGDDDEDFGALSQDVLRLKEGGLLQGIPIKPRCGVRTVLKDAYMSPVTAALLERGYDIRLGERGRNELKHEISRRLRLQPDLKVKCTAIARLKQANICQLVQLAEICGCLDKALVISQGYWTENTRRVRSPPGSKSPELCSPFEIYMTSPFGHSTESVIRAVEGVVAPSGVSIKAYACCQGRVLLDMGKTVSLTGGEQQVAVVEAVSPEGKAFKEGGIEEDVDATSRKRRQASTSTTPSSRRRIIDQ
eukprot:Blabericola_migrator_1__13363@NODE_948_length_5913_cov_205_487342_g658_i0_p3_GENE_NODE_948_length_5913_cov_205_487342_g658_i0NODE_948_length_5913_cov_205_487342_g658_i0_p3_ORF_typecomplete_len357_score42_11_NODE_948_length_5913_cov_205_487342_g658_i03751445